MKTRECRQRRVERTLRVLLMVGSAHHALTEVRTAHKLLAIQAADTACRGAQVDERVRNQSVELLARLGRDHRDSRLGAA